MWVVKVPNEELAQWFLLVWHLLKRWSEIDLWEHRKVKNSSIKSTRTWTFTDVKQQYRPVWRFRFEGKGNAVPFVLSEHCVSSWFSMLVEEWGLHRPPLLKVFHRGESSDTNGIQRVCHLCLWRRWNLVLCFTTIRLIDKADLNWFEDVIAVKKNKLKKCWSIWEDIRIWYKVLYCPSVFSKNTS